ncbi:MAG: lamin tail domain-containing protein [Proteobacteria bacterium]|nr:lamin tail domain-containing protein [Pseudomonadota bacterium]
MLRLAALAAALLLPATALAVDPGDVVFTEFAIAPAAGPEWFELYNPTASAVDLADCVLSEDDNLFTIDALVIGSRDYAVLSRSDTCAIYDDAGDCVADSDLVYGSLSLNNSGVETMGLTCDSVLIDAVGYDYDAFEDDCLDAGSCTVGLNGLGQSADTNDDWEGSWCVPTQLVYDETGGTVRASPWAPTDCVTGGPACGAGDVVVTEMMVDALASSDSREWFEVKVTTGSGCDLQGCQLWEGPTLEVPTDEVGGDDDDSAGDDDDDDEEADPCDEPIEGWRCHEVDAPGNTLAFDSGAYALFGKGADLIASSPEEIPVDYRYSGLFFNNDDPTYLHIVCNDTVVESARYDWSLFQGDCPNDGCTLQLHPSAEEATANDEPTGWCVASDEDEYRHDDEVGDPFFGTPGLPGACLAREWPNEGEVVFSELMLAPVSSSAEGAVSFPEWFELTSVTDRDVELEGCRVRRVRAGEVEGDDDDSAVPEDDVKEHQIGSEGLVPVLLSGTSQVLVKSECIDGTEAPETGICNTDGRTDYVYGTVSFSNGDVTEELILECPDVQGGDPVIVDRTSYNQQRMADRSGHSMEFNTTVADPASVNDDFALWCEASFQDCIDEAVTEDGDCNYGTPGTAGPCATGNVSVPPSGAGCRCDNIEARGGATGLGLLLLLGLLRRKKA